MISATAMTSISVLLLLFVTRTLTVYPKPTKIIMRCPSVTVHGAGSAFPSDFYKYAAVKYGAFRQKQGIDTKVVYRSVNSGYGKHRIVHQTEDPRILFAGTESMLNERTRVQHPDLLTIPVLAGALSIVYNLPNVSELILDYSVLSLIYRGNIRKWNDNRIQKTNPKLNLPDERILPIARSDDGGDTEIFTSALSSFDSVWNRTYKSFISPRFAKGICCEESQSWPKNVIHLYGNRALGMLGIISSIPYSIGYAATPNAAVSGQRSAKLINSAGSLTSPTLNSIQRAIDYHVAKNPGNYFFNISNAKAVNAYPIVSFSYVIVNGSKTPLTSCCMVRELVGFLDFVSRLGPEELHRFNLVSITEYGRQAIIQPVLRGIVCDGRGMLKEYRLTTESPSYASVVPTVVIACVGILFDEPVMMSDLYLGKPTEFSPKSRVMAVHGLQKVRSEHVLGLRGITTLQGRTKIIYTCPARGCVHFVLKNTKMKISPEIRVEIAKHAAEGLKFLHRRGIVHGTISSINTFFDLNWNIKYADWLNYSLTKQENSQVAVTMLNVLSNQDLSDEASAVQMIYLDPRARTRDLIYDGSLDVFSVSLLIVEIWNMACPYLEEMNTCELERFTRA